MQREREFTFDESTHAPTGQNVDFNLTRKKVIALSVRRALAWHARRPNEMFIIPIRIIWHRSILWRECWTHPSVRLISLTLGQ
jgi:hypothetical protein